MMSFNFKQWIIMIAASEYAQLVNYASEFF